MANEVETISLLKVEEDNPLDLRNFYDKRLNDGNELYRAHLLRKSALNKNLDRIIDLDNRHNTYIHADIKEGE